MIIIIENIRCLTVLVAPTSWPEQQSCKMLNIFYSLFDSLIVFPPSHRQQRMGEFGVRLVYLCSMYGASMLKMEQMTRTVYTLTILHHSLTSYIRMYRYTSTYCTPNLLY